MLFNLYSIVLALSTLPAIKASPIADAEPNADVQILYKTVTIWDHPAAIPTGIKINSDNDDDCDDDVSSSYASSSYYQSSYYPSSSSYLPSRIPVSSALTTLITVTRPATTEEAQVTTAAEVAETSTEASIQETTTTTPSTTSESTSAPTSNSIFDSSVHNGVATFYSVGADNCGTSSTDNDFVCAISQQMYNTVANSESISEYCGHMINLTYNGKTIQVKVVDSCASCDANHLDLSPAAFNSLADPSLGVIDIQWTWA